MSLSQFSYVTFESLMALICLVLAIFVFHTRKKGPKTARAMEGVALGACLFNAAYAVSDYSTVKLTDAVFGVTQGSLLLVFVFLHAFLAFQTAYTGKILYLSKSGKPLSGRLQLIIYILCAAGGLMTLFSLIFCLTHVIDYQSGDFWFACYIFEMSITQAVSVLLFVLVIRNRSFFCLGEFRYFLLITIALMAGPITQTVFSEVEIFNFMPFFAAVMSTVVYWGEVSDLTIYKEGIPMKVGDIDMLSGELEGFLDKVGSSRKMNLTLKLKFEETILRMRDRFGEDAKMDFRATAVFGKPSIRMALEGMPYNPLAEDESLINDWSMEMLRGTTVRPRYSYVSGKNHIRLAFPRQKSNPALTMIVCIALGLALGGLAEFTLSEEGLVSFTDHLLDPAYNLLINMLSCAAGPIIFFMVINTILNSGAISRQGISSGLSMGRYFLLSGAMAALAAVVLCMSAFHIVKAGIPGNEAILQFMEKIINLVPDDVFDPVTEANTPQLLFLAIVLGYAVVATAPRGNTLSDLLRQSNHVGMRIAEWIGTILPYFTLLIVAYAVVRAQGKAFLLLVAMILTVLLISSLCAAGSVLYVSYTRKVKAGIIMRKCLSSLKYALRTGSAYTAYDTAEECCINELGVRKSFAAASMPMGTVLYMPANAIGAVVFVIFAEDFLDTQISPLWLVGAIVLSVVLIAATPPIPGANCLAFMMIISLLGIDKQAIILALLYDILFSSFSTAANQLMLQMEMIVQADRVGMLDKEKLIS